MSTLPPQPAPIGTEASAATGTNHTAWTPLLAGLLVPVMHVAGLVLWLAVQGGSAPSGLAAAQPFAFLTLLILAAGVTLAGVILLAQARRRPGR